MGLSVLSVAFPFAPVGEDAAGGAEQVLGLLESGLVQRGHRSLVVACEGSRTAGELVATPAARGPVDDAARRVAWRRHRQALESVLERESIDLVHMHGLDFCEYLPAVGPPVLATLHLSPALYPAPALRPCRPATYLQCVSRTQKLACPPSVPIAAVVPNGVAVDRLGCGAARAGTGAYVAAIGRVCPEKGLHLALEAAHRADVDCRVAGRVFPYESHRRHFEQEIRPRLDARRVFVGVVGLEQKRQLLSGARCVLVPSLVDETSSLVAMEALACGTPVVAFARGALTEIVEHGRTGFLVEDVAQMATAIADVARLDRDACREAARSRFSAQSMVDRYLALYGTLAGQGAPAPARPAVAAPVSSLRLELAQ